MKRKWIGLAVLLAIVAGMGQVAYAGEFEDITVYVDGEKVDFDTQPVIVGDRTLVPVRGVFEKLGATVEWNRSTNQVIVKDDGMELLMEIGNDAVLKDGRIEMLDTRSMIIDDRTMVPLRFIAESLGYKVEWNGVTHRIDIETQEKGVQVEEGLPVIGSREQFVELLRYSHNLNDYIQSRFYFEDEITVNTEDSFSEAVAAEKEAGDYSDTNNQVEGVDEGDLVKTDGSYIYYVKDNSVLIFDANPLAPELITTLSLDGNRGSLSDIYVSEGKLTVMGTSVVYYAYPVELELVKGGMPYYNTSNTFVLVYDLADISSPVCVLDMDFEGTLASSRMVDGSLYFATNKSIDYYTLDRQMDSLQTYEVLPKYMDNLQGEQIKLDYGDIYYFPDYVDSNFLTTVGVNLETMKISVESYLGRAETVYASQENMYLTFTNYSYTNSGNGLLYVPDYKVSTSIYKFGLSEGVMTYRAQGQVDGTVVNQFSLDEEGSNLRIATTTGEMWNPSNPSLNNLTILDEQLKVVGELRGLAEGEKIYSTRFAGERIYMVTYRQVDPFFVIDASDPGEPKVLGQLKLPGFSTYMHILDENHVLGFGKDTQSNGDFVTTGGFKMSLFDVTDPSNPIEKQQEIIGTSGAYSELESNHKALMISLTKGIMGFPITVASDVPYATSFSGAYIYDLTTEDFTYKGQISHDSSQVKWDYNNRILRILFIGDYLYTLSGNKMEVTGMADMKTVGEIEFR